MEVYNSVGPSLIDDMGHTFRVSSQMQAQTLPLKLQQIRKAKNIHVDQITPMGVKVTAAEAAIIPPSTVTKVLVLVPFPKNATCLFVD